MLIKLFVHFSFAFIYLFIYLFMYVFIYLCIDLFFYCLFIYQVCFVFSGPLSIFQALCQYSKILVYICVSKIFSSTTFIRLFVDIAKYWCIHVLVRF